jgi:hypothetical protein
MRCLLITSRGSRRTVTVALCLCAIAVVSCSTNPATGRSSFTGLMTTADEVRNSSLATMTPKEAAQIKPQRIRVVTSARATRLRNWPSGWIRNIRAAALPGAQRTDRRRQAKGTDATKDRGRMTGHFSQSHQNGRLQRGISRSPSPIVRYNDFCFANFGRIERVRFVPPHPMRNHTRADVGGEPFANEVKDLRAVGHSVAM